MKVYLAARYSQKEEIIEKAAELRALGITVTSSWLEEPHSADATLRDINDNLLHGYAVQDLKDIDAADIFVFFSTDPTMPTVRGGRHVEFGYALYAAMHCERDKRIVIVGPKENIFHYLESQVIHCPTWEVAKAGLAMLQNVWATI